MSVEPGDAVDLGEVWRHTSHGDMLVARGVAINQYAQLEQSLASLFSTLLQSDYAASSLIFYRIVNTRSRLEIMKGLQKLRYGEEYGIFLSSIWKHVVGLDNERNQIIHWHNVTAISSQDNVPVELRPPAFFSTKSDARMTVLELQQFASRCDYVSRGINCFILARQYPYVADDVKGMVEVALTWPPPDGHFLMRQSVSTAS